MILVRMLLDSTSTALRRSTGAKDSASAPAKLAGLLRHASTSVSKSESDSLQDDEAVPTPLSLIHVMVILVVLIPAVIRG